MKSLTARPDISGIAAAVGEPSRGKMLNALMDGCALTATELAFEAGVTPSTASTHLEKLRQAGLISCAIQGRHRYFRIATTEVAGILESLMGLAVADRRTGTGPPEEALRRARICYDHLAGELGVRLLERMRERRLVRGDGEFLELTAHGSKWIADFGIDLEGLHRKRRPLVRPCLDWSERRYHLAGAVGAAILDRLLDLRLAKRDSITRAVSISERGEAFFADLESNICQVSVQHRG